MAYTLDDFWKILAEIQGDTTDLTEAVKSIAHNEQATSQRLLDIVIDQIAYNSPDWNRIKNFVRDWYATHRAVTSFQSNVSDIYQMPNDQLDELFRSFGYDYSALLQDPTNNEAPAAKVNFFLDLVNLYKRKGTPQTLVDVLQYYGINEIDVYSLQLQFEDRLKKDNTDIIFKGKVAAGTSGDKTPIYLPFRFLTDSDPHWLQTESQIRQLYDLNKINFPSQSPYFALKPLFNEEATDAATGILSNLVQSQYGTWDAAGKPDEKTTPVLDQNAVMTITGETVSMLTLYLSSIYTFFKEFHVGHPAARFICYDGTNTDSIDIIDEFRDLTDTKIFSRTDWKTRWEQYIQIFSRDISTNFLQLSTDAGDVLSILNPSVKTQLDGLAADNITVLGTLLRDLGEWVRNNISFGFINMSYILFGLDSFFAQLSEVIEFFKPYRARLIPLETIDFSNRLFNSIIVEDRYYLDIEQDVHDFVTGDGIPCCTEQGIDSTTPVCIDSTSTKLFRSRETYDCGSWHDIGAVTDICRDIFIDFDDQIHSALRCPAYYGDGTAAIIAASTLGAPYAPIVTSEIIDYVPMEFDIANIAEGSDTFTGILKDPPGGLGYALTLNLFNDDDPDGDISTYSHIITNKTAAGFTAKISDSADSTYYSASYDYSNDATNSGIIHVPLGVDQVTIYDIAPPDWIVDGTTYTVALSLENTTDSTASFYFYSVTERTPTHFTVQFSGAMDSNNYYLNWILIEHEKRGIEDLMEGWTSVVVPLHPMEVNDNYGVSLTLLNTTDSTSSIIPFVVVDKSINGFKVLFDSPIDSPNYKLMWSRPIGSNLQAEDYKYYQSGAFTNFDGVPAWDGTAYTFVEGTAGAFDCTHGFDLVQIDIVDTVAFLQQESANDLNKDYILQENGFRIQL